jgi:RNase P subunit RPR2
VTVTLVCGKCQEPTREDHASVEINFNDGHIHFMCPSCKHMNRLQLKKPDVPLPKTRRLAG